MKYIKHIEPKEPVYTLAGGRTAINMIADNDGYKPELKVLLTVADSETSKEEQYGYHLEGSSYPDIMSCPDISSIVGCVEDDFSPDHITFAEVDPSDLVKYIRQYT